MHCHVVCCKFPYSRIILCRRISCLELELTASLSQEAGVKALIRVNQRLVSRITQSLKYICKISNGVFENVKTPLLIGLKLPWTMNRVRWNHSFCYLSTLTRPFKYTCKNCNLPLVFKPLLQVGKLRLPNMPIELVQDN